MPHGDWDQLSSAATAALRLLAAMPNGSCQAGAISGVRMATWRSLQRYSQIRTSDHEEPKENSIITITESGLESIGAGAANERWKRS